MKNSNLIGVENEKRKYNPRLIIAAQDRNDEIARHHARNHKTRM